MRLKHIWHKHVHWMTHRLNAYNATYAHDAITRETAPYSPSHSTLDCAPKNLLRCVLGMHMTQKEQCVMHLFYSAAKPKVLAHVLFISIAPYALHWSSIAQLSTVLSQQHPCLRAVKVDTLVQTLCANCSSTCLQIVDYVVQHHIHRVAHSSPNLPTKVWAFVFLLS